MEKVVVRFDGVDDTCDPSAPSADTPGVVKAWTDAAVVPLIVVEVANARGGCDAIQGSGRSDAARAEGRCGRYSTGGLINATAVRWRANFGSFG